MSVSQLRERGAPLARLAAKPMATTDGGYPWHDGELLYADDLNAAFAGGASVAAINPATNTYGIQSFPNTDIYQSPDSYAMSGSMTIRGQPYGYYDTGTLLSIVATTNPLSESRAGVAGGFEAGVPAIASYGAFDSVNIYSGITDGTPPLVLHNVTYDATHVYPQPALTADQISRLRVNMWVLTNSIDPTVSTTPAIPGGWKPENHYGSYVTGWAADGTSITVVGWTVPGSGHTGVGQVPGATLDAGAPYAIAYFGSPTSAFGANFVAQHYPDVDGRTRGYTGVEFDFWNYATNDYEMSVNGIAIAFNSQYGAAMTTDSFGIKISGAPNGIIINYAGTGLHIEATTAITSNVFNANHWWSPQPWDGLPKTMLTWESNNYIDSNLLALKCWVSRDVNGIGWPAASLHLGMYVDASELGLDGSPMAQLVWNPQGYAGGLQIQTSAGVPGITMDSLGNVTFHGELVTGSSGAIYAQTLYAQGTARGGFVGSIQSGGAAPSAIGFWNQDEVLIFGVGAGDIAGTPSSQFASIDSSGNLGISGSFSFGAGAGGTLIFNRLPINAASDSAAAGLGVGIGGTYRNGSQLMVRVS